MKKYLTDMRARCENCNTYYSVRQTRGSKLSDLRCRKDGGKLIALTSIDRNKMKDKTGAEFTYDIPLISGVSVFLEVEKVEYSDGKDYSDLKPNLDLKKHEHLFDDGCVNCGSKEVTVTDKADICHACGYVYT